MLPYTWDDIKHLPHHPFAYGGEVEVQKSTDGGAGLIDFKIENKAHFWTATVQISFNTLDAAGVDDGVCHLSGTLKTTNKPLFVDDQFLANFAVPGRQRTAGVAGDPGNSLHIAGMPFPVFWEINDQVQLDLRNDIDFAQYCKLTLLGFNFPTNTFTPPR